MKRLNSIQLFVAVLGFILTLNSCEKVIEVKVDDADQRVVIEAKLSNEIGGGVVKLTKTLPLNSTSDYELVSGAEVYITNLSTTNRIMLNETEQGIYKNETLEGEPGVAYKLEVITTDGQTFTAQDVMPLMTTLEDVSIEIENFAFFEPEDEGDNFYQVKPVFEDMEGVENFYQILVKQEDEGEDMDDIDIFKDLGFDGLTNTQSVYIDAFPGETIHVELQSITEASYDYLASLITNMDQSSGSPTNPETNIQGGALGYFKAYTKGGVIEVVAPEEETESE